MTQPTMAGEPVPDDESLAGDPAIGGDGEDRTPDPVPALPPGGAD